MNLSFNYLSSNFHPFESSIPKLLQISIEQKIKDNQISLQNFWEIWNFSSREIQLAVYSSV